MEVPEHQPEKSSRPVPEMLDEILQLVRSIDKATNRAGPDLNSLWNSQSSSEMQRTESARQKLVSEVRKLAGTVLAQALSNGVAAFDGDTLTISVPLILPETHLGLVKEVADRIGLKVALHWPDN
jgi:hypothetical protein